MMHFSRGHSHAEALRNIPQAIKVDIEITRDQGEPVPPSLGEEIGKVEMRARSHEYPDKRSFRVILAFDSSGK